MPKSPAQKMGIKEGSRAILIDAPADAVEAIQLPPIHTTHKLTGEFDYIHLFVKTADALTEYLPKLKAHLAAGGMLWVSWPKGGGLGTDLNIKNIIGIGYSFGLVESIALSTNAVWSGLKFTHPKPGKVYNNSYGTLPSHPA